HQLEKRPAADRHHRLRQAFSRCAKASAESASENDDLHLFTRRARHNRLNVHIVLLNRCSVDAPIRSRYSIGMSVTRNPMRYGITSMSTGSAGPFASHCTLSIIDLRYARMPLCMSVVLIPCRSRAVHANTRLAM